MAYDWYASCTDIAQRNQLGILPMVQLLKVAMKTDEFVPFLPRDWDGANLDLEATLARVNRLYTVGPFLGIAMAGNAKNTSSPSRITVSTRNFQERVHSKSQEGIRTIHLKGR